MPIFEYICKDCSRRFEALVLSAKNGSRQQCPHCHSQKLEQQLSVFAVAGSSKSAADSSAPAGPCGSCGDPRGPGACSLD